MDIEYLKQYQYNTDLQFSNKYLVKDAENTTPQVIQWKISQSQTQTKKRGRPPKPKVEKIPKPKVRRVTKIKVERPRKPIEPEPQIIIDRNINRTIIF
jgi:hypothetical protein